MASMSRPAGLPRDALLAAAAFAGTVLQLAHGGVAAATRLPGGLDAAALALAALATAPIVAARRFPAAVFAATGAGVALLAVHGHPLDLAIGPTVALFLLASAPGEAGRWTWWRTLLVVAVFTGCLAAVAAARSGAPGIAVLHTGLAWAAAWFAGDRTRLRRDQLDLLRQRARRAEQAVARERRLAVAEERARIARDLHDSAAHAISLIAVRAGTARLRFGEDPQRTRAALDDVERLARRTAEEMNDIVGGLRDPAVNGGVEAPAGLASLASLIAHHAEGGLPVTVRTSGTPHPLAAAADQAAYRILQESLTNAARHGSGGAHIELRHDRDCLDITVANPAPGGTGAGAGGGGHGLIGMRERATLLGGTLRVEDTGGTFRVLARIPTGGHRP